MHGRNFARSLQERVLAAALAPRLYPSSDTFGHSTLSSSDQPTLNGLPWTLGGWMAGHGPSWVYILSAWCHVGRVLARGFGGWNEQPDVSICECRVLVTWTPAGWLLLTLSGLWSWFGRSVVSDSLRPHGLQHARLPCPLPSLGLYLSPIASFQGLFSKFSKPGFSNTWTVNFQMFKLVLEKATCILVADSFWYMAKPIQYYKVKK